MSLPKILQNNLSIPVIGSPLFLCSGPELVIAQCKAGIVASRVVHQTGVDSLLHDMTGLHALRVRVGAHPIPVYCTGKVTVVYSYK